jgi:hypothetical protein
MEIYEELANFSEEGKRLASTFRSRANDEHDDIHVIGLMTIP